MPRPLAVRRAHKRHGELSGYFAADRERLLLNS
jgi:hypothetical protein